MNILVTGGAGYIGSYAVNQLLKRGHHVSIVDNLSTGSTDALVEGIPFYEGDIRDSAFLKSVFSREQVDLVMHFAAKLIAPESVEKPLEYYSNNTVGMHVLLSTMKECGVNRIVFSSTAAVYGLLDKAPITEEDPTCPINPYGETKLASEKMIQWASNAYGLQYVIFRYFNVAGGRKPGYSPLYQTSLVPRVLCAAEGLVPKLSIFGDDYDTEDGTCIRDFVHVEDLASAHVLAAEKMIAGTCENGIYHLGSGNGFSVLDVFEIAKKVTNVDIPYEIAPRRLGDPVKSVASSRKAQEQLGWTRNYETLEMIITDAWKHIHEEKVHV
ncbi:MAG: UDP-glucose 4-epimerase GalE [Bacillaceae bacterium]